MDHWPFSFLLLWLWCSIHSPLSVQFSICKIVVMILLCFSSRIFFFAFCFLGLHLQHMDLPRLGVESELQLLISTATTKQDLSRICNLHHSSRPCCILNPLNEARDWTHNLMGPSQIHFRCASYRILQDILRSSYYSPSSPCKMFVECFQSSIITSLCLNTFFKTLK